jgi:polar amino acid transport system substrate-binding protein
VHVRLLRGAAAFAALALALAACADDDADPADDPAAEDDVADDEWELELVSEGTLTVCSEVPYEPFEFEDPDSEIGYSGFDIDLMNEIADRIGIAPITVINTGFEGLTSGAEMAAGTCDVAASAMTITEERQENVDFTDHYYESLQSLLVPVDSDIQSIDDLTEGVTVGVQSGTTGADYAEENVPGAEIRSFDTGGDLFTALAAGQIDAILQDLPVNEVYAEQNEDAEVVEEYDTDENYGFALEQDRGDDLLEALNDGLAQVREDGTYDELFEQYFAVVE